MPVWRNWQTQWTQNPPKFTSCRFESGHWYHKKYDTSLNEMFFLLDRNKTHSTHLNYHTVY